MTDVVHMTCRSVGEDAQSDLKPVAELLFNRSDNEDCLYLGSYYDKEILAGTATHPLFSVVLSQCIWVFHN